MTRPSSKSFEERLADGVMIGAEGYVFELERRGYVKAGPYVPEVILDAPDAGRPRPRAVLPAGGAGGSGPSTSAGSVGWLASTRSRPG